MVNSHLKTETLHFKQIHPQAKQMYRAHLNLIIMEMQLQNHKCFSPRHQAKDERKIPGKPHQLTRGHTAPHILRRHCSFGTYKASLFLCPIKVAS